MSSEVYIVVGRTGEYAEKRWWCVRAHMELEYAERDVKRLNDWCSKYNCHWGYLDSPTLPENKHGDMIVRCPHDPNFQLSYTGTIYEITTIPLTL